MSTDRLRRATRMLPWTLIGLLALLPAGCSSNQANSAQEKGKAARSTFRPGTAKPAAAEKTPKGGEIKDPLLKTFDEALNAADDLDRSERNEARGILEEADPLLRKIREENRQAIKRMNARPRIVPPKKAIPKAAPDATKGVKPEAKTTQGPAAPKAQAPAPKSEPASQPQTPASAVPPPKAP